MHDGKYSIFSNKTPNLWLFPENWKKPIKNKCSLHEYSACTIHVWYFFTFVIIKNINMERGVLILWGDQFMQLKIPA